MSNFFFDFLLFFTFLFSSGSEDEWIILNFLIIFLFFYNFVGFFNFIDFFYYLIFGDVMNVFCLFFILFDWYFDFFWFLFNWMWVHLSFDSFDRLFDFWIETLIFLCLFLLWADIKYRDQMRVLVEFLWRFLIGLNKWTF